MLLIYVTDQLVHEDELLVAFGPLTPVHVFLVGFVSCGGVEDADVRARGTSVRCEWMDLQEKSEVRYIMGKQIK